MRACKRNGVELTDFAKISMSLHLLVTILRLASKPTGQNHKIGGCIGIDHMPGMRDHRSRGNHQCRGASAHKVKRIEADAVGIPSSQ
jgi:hypothetical protein